MCICLSRVRRNGRTLCHLHAICRAGTHEKQNSVWNADLTFLLVRDPHSSGGQTGVSFGHSRRANEEVALNTKANREVKGGSNATNRIISAGEIFADGSMIELVSGSSALDKPDFLLWNGKKATVGTHIKHGGRTYEVPELDSSLYRATRLPSRCTEYGSARGFFAAIANLFKHHLDLPARESSLVACFSISTWLADCLPTAPSLAISGLIRSWE